MRIAISPDENPGDPGSVAADGTTERSLNLRVAGALLGALRRCGQDAWFDPSLTYVERVAQANTDGTQLLCACAHNESTPGVSGTQFVFCPGGLTFGRQAAAADAIYAELAQLPGWPTRRRDAVENVWECCGFDGDAIYIEILCMSQPDEALWSQLGYEVAVAEAVTRAVASTYGFPYVGQEADMTNEEHGWLQDLHTGMGSLVSIVPGQAPPLVFQLRDQLVAVKAELDRVASTQSGGTPADLSALTAAVGLADQHAQAAALLAETHLAALGKHEGVDVATGVDS